MRRLVAPSVWLLTAACWGADTGSTGTSVACDAMAAVSVAVTVTDGAGAAVPGVAVSYVADAGPSGSCDGVPDGTWMCGYEVAGRIVVTARAAGFADATAEVVIEQDVCHVVGQSITLVMEPLG